MPAQNVPPAPVSTIATTSGRGSSSSMAAAMPLATASLTALRACGRLMVMTATPPSTSTDRSVSGAHFGWNLMPPSKRMTSAFM